MDHHRTQCKFGLDQPHAKLPISISICPVQRLATTNTTNQPTNHVAASLGGASDSVWLLTLRSKHINSTSGCKYLTENGFSDIDFLYDVEILAVRRCFTLILAIFTVHAQFRPYYYFRFKIWRYIWIQRIRFPIKLSLIHIWRCRRRG